MGFLRLILIFIGMWLMRVIVRGVMRRSVGAGPRPGRGGYGQWGPRGGPTPDFSNRYRSPHEVLGVDRGASAEEISSAYRKLVQQYHPDRVADLGPELREVAEQRMKEINAAYEELKRKN